MHTTADKGTENESIIADSQVDDGARVASQRRRALVGRLAVR